MDAFGGVVFCLILLGVFWNSCGTSNKEKFFECVEKTKDKVQCSIYLDSETDRKLVLEGKLSKE